MALLHVDFFSDALGMCAEMDVILPEATRGLIGMNGKEAIGKVPTLYLLHGMSDDHTIWQRRTSIERYATEAGIAVVMPSTHLGWYTDMYRGHKYWTYITQELPAICHSFFPCLSDKREDTFAAGLSMGGYGAMKCGICASQTFSKVASLSGGLDVVAICQNNTVRNDDTLWEDIFGPADSVRGSFNDLFAQAEKLSASGDPKPDIFMWCGTEDFLYDQNTAMRDHLTKLNFNLHYEESPGDHQWKYWDEKIQTVISWLNCRKEA